jgi:hypothetical protein
MEYLEISGSALLVAAFILWAISLFIPRVKILKIKPDSVPPSMSGHFVLLKAIHSIPFWMLNSLGKALRISIDASALVGLLFLSITYWSS